MYPDAASQSACSRMSSPNPKASCMTIDAGPRTRAIMTETGSAR